jgi:sugar-specific transcriptional regulator TrmB
LSTVKLLTYEEMSTSDHFEKLHSELASVLNLEKLEAQLYLHLLRTGPITASALAKELDIDRARSYRTIDKMIRGNIISTTFSSPKLCMPIKPEEVLKLALKKK